MKYVQINRNMTRVFNYIQAYSKKHGFSPLTSEIAKGLDLGMATVFRVLNDLEEMESIERRKRKKRGIILIIHPKSLLEKALLSQS